MQQHQPRYFFLIIIILVQFTYLIHKLFSPGRGLSNGTSIVYEGLQLHPDEDVHRIHNNILTATEGQDVELIHPPLFIIVSVPGADPAEFQDRTLVPGRVVIPVPEFVSLESVDIQLPGRTKKDTFKYKPHAVELRFAITINKVQGQTCDKIILQLNKRSFVPYLIFNMLYVALSRVRKGADIRLMPPHPNNSSLDYLANLKPNEDLLTWLDAFDEDVGAGASWNTEKAITIHNRKQQSPSTRDKTRPLPKKVLPPTQSTLLSTSAPPSDAVTTAINVRRAAKRPHQK